MLEFRKLCINLDEEENLVHHFNNKKNKNKKHTAQEINNIAINGDKINRNKKETVRMFYQ